MKNKFVYILTIAFLALFTGASLTVLLVIVPFWLTLQPKAFLDWFYDFHVQIAITMFLLEIIPLILSFFCYFAIRRTKGQGKKLWIAINISNIIILLTLCYFIPVNLSFINKTINPLNVPGELIRWKALHVVRTSLSILSTAIGIVAVSISRDEER